MPGDESGGHVLYTDKLSDQVYALLRDQITNGALKPGARLNLARMTEELGISKTPLREALHRLELEQLVETKPRSGTYVAVPNLRDIAEVCDLRKALEWQAVKLATSRIPQPLLEDLKGEIVRAEKRAREGDFGPFVRSDAKLHRAIFEHCGNRRLARVRESIDTYVRWLSLLGATGLHRVVGSSLRHKQIVEALLKRDSRKAQELMELHIEEVKTWIMEDLGGEGVRIPDEIAKAMGETGKQAAAR